METKLFEVLEGDSFFVVMATRMDIDKAGLTHKDRWLLQQAAFGKGHGYPVHLTLLDDKRTNFDAFKWGSERLCALHLHLNQYFDQLSSGAVIDLDYLTGKKEVEGTTKFRHASYVNAMKDSKQNQS